MKKNEDTKKTGHKISLLLVTTVCFVRHHQSSVATKIVNITTVRQGQEQRK